MHRGVAGAPHRLPEPRVTKTQNCLHGGLRAGVCKDNSRALDPIAGTLDLVTSLYCTIGY